MKLSTYQSLIRRNSNEIAHLHMLVGLHASSLMLPEADAYCAANNRFFYGRISKYKAEIKQLAAVQVDLKESYKGMCAFKRYANAIHRQVAATDEADRSR
jgi:hypothetical protein